MNVDTLHIADQRMLQLLEDLKAGGHIRYYQEFLDVIGMKKQNLRAVREGRTGFTTEQIRLACKAFKVNCNWIMGLEKIKYR